MNDKLKHIALNYLNKEYSGLVRYETDGYPNFIFFMKDGKFIFDYNTKHNSVHISYVHIWSFLSSIFGLNFKEIQDLTKQWVEEQFKLDMTTIYNLSHDLFHLVEEQFKLDMTTMNNIYYDDNSKVEEHYKLETNE